MAPAPRPVFEQVAQEALWDEIPSRALPSPLLHCRIPHTYGTKRSVGLREMKGGVVLRLLLYWLRALRASIGVLLRLAERALHRVPGCRLLRALHPWPRDHDGAPTSRRIVVTWQRGTAGTGDWSEIQEQPPRRHEDEDGTCTHWPEPQLPATSSIQSLFDGAGRLDLAGLRKVVYETGTDASERKVTWKFLFGVYPADSTTEERHQLDQQLVARYRSMKNAWKQQFPSARRMKVQSDLELSLAIKKYEQRETEAAKVPTEHGLWLQSINQPQFWASLRDIDADVPRTDRHRSFFQRQGLVKLLKLREILITFAAFHQDIGYCQGMTNFASHFLETLDSEFDAFWCFVNCMRHWGPSLTAQGVARKIREQRAETTEELLRHVDPELYHHIARTSKERLLFCVSWLLLRFQRELGHEDALRVMEIGALEGGPTELAARLLPNCREGEDGPAPHRDAVSFEVLLCVALLIQHRQQLLQYQHVHDFFLFAHRLQGKLALDALRRVDRPL